MSYTKIIADLEKVLEAHQDDEYALAMSAYMKDHFTFYGIKSKPRQELAKPFIKELVKNHKKDYWAIAELLWDKEERDFHYVAMEFLKKTYSEWDVNTIDLLEWLVSNHSWWDSVDFIASHLVGKYIQLFHPENYAVMDDWNKSENMWIVRTSILFQLKYKEKMNWELLQKYILRHDASSEFFIRKAIGWVLREYSKTEADVVVQFVKENSQLSGLSKREALKWLKGKGKL